VKALDLAKRIANPVVIVTGASSGIGRALALRLGSEGYRVGLIARRRDELEAVACQIAVAIAGSPTSGIGLRSARPSPRSRIGSARPT
jgi:NAD(P)-dependent dehydrogenase (short-subunit alcohol dehydrogenase family)